MDAVLIVDDNMFNLIPLELLLDTEFDIKVEKASNGKEAVELFKENLERTCCSLKYKLILMDLNMPIMDGYTATIEIQEYIETFNACQKSSEVKSRCKIVAITAYENP